MCHYGNAWCRNQSDSEHECPRQPTDWLAVAKDICLPAVAAPAKAAAIPETITHPIGRSVHAVHEALRYLNTMTDPTRNNPQSLRMDASDVRRLLEPVLPDLAATMQFAERQEEHMRDVVTEGIEVNRQLTAERERNTLIEQELAALRKRFDMHAGEIARVVGSVSLIFSEARALKADADRAGIPHSLTLHDAPRTAVAGGR